jgi:putative endonuclease
MPNARQTLGTWGETLAADYLAEKGYILLERNACTPHGELDLVTRQGSVIVFVEVKARSTSGYGHPEESITPAKQAHLIASAITYLQTHPDLDGEWRIDVIAIRQRKGQRPENIHFENAVGG